MRKPVTAVLPALLAIFTTPVDAQTGLTGGYGWKFVSADRRVDREAPYVEFTESGTTIQSTLTDFEVHNGPFETTASVLSIIRGDIQRRTLGAGSSATVRVNPFDPDDDNLRPLLIEAQVVSSVKLVDEVSLVAEGLAAGELVDMILNAPRLSGRLAVPPNDEGEGTAIVTLTVGIDHLPQPGKLQLVRQSYVFEKVVGGDTGETSWDGSGFADKPFGQTGARLMSGEDYRLTVELRTNIQLLPFPFPANDPPLGTALSSFGNTLTWGGVRSFSRGGQTLSAVRLNSEIGFDWITPAPVREPSPELRLDVSGAGVSVHWGAEALGWRLQKTSDLNDWLDVNGEISESGTYTQALTDPSAFFRLAKP